MSLDHESALRDEIGRMHAKYTGLLVELDAAKGRAERAENSIAWFAKMLDCDPDVEKIAREIGDKLHRVCMDREFIEGLRDRALDCVRSIRSSHSDIKHFIVIGNTVVGEFENFTAAKRTVAKIRKLIALFMEAET